MAVIIYCALRSAHFPHTNTQIPCRKWIQSIVAVPTCIFLYSSFAVNYTWHTSALGLWNALSVMQQQVIVENLCIIFSTQGLNGTWGQNSSLFLWHEFNDFMEKEPCPKFCGVLIHSSHEVMKLQSFESSVIDLIPANVQNIFHFSWTYEIAKFWMIKLCLDASDVIHANDDT